MVTGFPGPDPSLPLSVIKSYRISQKRSKRSNLHQMKSVSITNVNLLLFPEGNIIYSQMIKASSDQPNPSRLIRAVRVSWSREGDITWSGRFILIKASSNPPDHPIILPDHPIILPFVLAFLPLSGLFHP